MWRLIWWNDHLYCGFGARRFHLNLHWMSAQGSVGFRWGTITGPYHANLSQVETHSSVHIGFIVFNGDVITFFAKSVPYRNAYSNPMYTHLGEFTTARPEFWRLWQIHEDVIKWKHFRVTGPLCGEFPGHRGIPFTKASAELRVFLSSALEWTVE